jgi:hypothetical protein
MTEERKTKNQRVLELMSDHRWHTTVEIETSLRIRNAHSRLSDLRTKHECVFETRPVGGGSKEYRLVTTGDQLRVAHAALRSSSLAELAATDPAAGSSSVESASDSRATLTAEGGLPGRRSSLPPPGPAADPHDQEDAGWRELFRGPVDEQLSLGGMRP